MNDKPDSEYSWEELGALRRKNKRPDYQADVTDFHIDVCGIDAPAKPTLEGYPFELRANLILEEAQEFVEACGMKAGDNGYGNWGDLKAYTSDREPNQTKMIDALIDILYVTIGAAVQMGIDLDPFWSEVHRSNMAKRGGEVRADGKRLKPPGWTPPDIEGVLKKQTEGE